MKIARDRGKLRGKPPKLSDLQQRELLKLHATGEYSISDLGKLFKVSRPTVYRTIRRGEAAEASDTARKKSRTSLGAEQADVDARHRAGAAARVRAREDKELLRSGSA